MNQNLVQPHSHSQSHDIGALGLRLSLGSILLAHGLMKLLVFGVAGTVGFFASLGLPAIVAQLTILLPIALRT